MRSWDPRWSRDGGECWQGVLAATGRNEAGGEDGAVFLVHPGTVADLESLMLPIRNGVLCERGVFRGRTS